jgi:hypothetical protein
MKRTTPRGGPGVFPERRSTVYSEHIGDTLAFA